MKKFVFSVCALFAAATISFAQDVNEATDLFNAAVEYLNLGDKTSALENFQKAYDIAKECGEAGQALVDQCESTIPQLALMVAKDYVKAGDYATAVVKAQEASAVAAAMNADASVAEAEALIPNIYMQQGNVLLKAKDYEGAIKAYSANVALNPANGKAYVNMAAAYDRLGQSDKAEENYLLAAANGQEKAANKALGNIYLKKALAANKAKSYDQAIEMANKSISFNETSKAHYIIGLAAQNSNKIALAISSFEKYLELDPTAANAQDVRTVVEALKKAKK